MQRIGGLRVGSPAPWSVAAGSRSRRATPPHRSSGLPFGPFLSTGAARPRTGAATAGRVGRPRFVRARVLLPLAPTCMGAERGRSAPSMSLARRPARPWIAWPPAGRRKPEPRTCLGVPASVRGHGGMMPCAANPSTVHARGRGWTLAE
jgi:hypothetical protein